MSLGSHEGSPRDRANILEVERLHDPAPALHPGCAGIAVVIPSYRVREHIAGVIAAIGPEVQAIYVVDDACPEATGDFVANHISDPRVRVLRNAQNMGVGGAVITGYRQAVADGARIAIKIDGDGQMDPRLISRFVDPILRGAADYTKGNRFFNLGDVVSMPKARLLGNAALSFITKVSTGYWSLFDPTNGYTAIDLRMLQLLDLDKVNRGYFFETDMLFRLNIARAVVADIPMRAAYGNEQSNLRIARVLGPFLLGNLRNLAKRLFYSYFLRDFSVASVELVLGTVMVTFGLTFGISQWTELAREAKLASSGTVMLAALPVIVGMQLLLSFLSYDVGNQPSSPISTKLGQLPSVG
jgi:glycosyltransferase involved in cell wall biosynthesis